MSEAKRALRRVVRQRIAAWPDQARREASTAICARLQARLPPGPVLAYVALPDEVDLGPLFELLASRGDLWLPRVAGAALEAVPVADASAPMAEGPHRLQEPTGPAGDPGDLVAILVPGRAYDRRGGRLGRGGGHYDRFLVGAPRAARIGVAWSVQWVDAVPIQEHDQRMHAVVTEAEIVECGKP